jgi:hypothetical protein
MAALGGACATGIIDTQTAMGLTGIAVGVFLGQPGGLLGGSFVGAVTTGGIAGGISSGCRIVTDHAFQLPLVGDKLDRLFLPHFWPVLHLAESIEHMPELGA